MTIEQIGIGAAPGDNTGDGLRTAMGKVNNNFSNSSHAASKLVGTAAGEIPLAEDSWNDLTVEYGVNANGEFWKYPDGRLVCSYSDNKGQQAYSANGGIASSPAFSWTFPTLEFIAVPVVGVAGGSQANAFTWGSFNTPTTSFVGYRMLTTAVNGSVETIAELTAQGRWK